MLYLFQTPQPKVAKGRGSAQLLDALIARIAQKGDAVHMPPDFLEQFAARFEDEGLAELMPSIGELCSRQNVTAWSSPCVLSSARQGLQGGAEAWLGALGTLFHQRAPLARPQASA